MRVISGAFRGRTLHVPVNATFRPTTDRVKESVFNILAGRIRWEAAMVCDLFAGSGSLGIESLSRGAPRCCFVEASRESLRVLDRNLAELGLAPQADVVRGKVELFLAGRGPQTGKAQTGKAQTGDTTRPADPGFDVMFADPPYHYPEVAPLLDGMVARLSPDGIAVFEHERKLRIESTDILEVFDRREYGSTAITFFQPPHGGNE
ncbi:MAG: 16S rRNA (guanine(966)-N(2))-methyltransferase RsmD [Bacteroidetes bacterium]|nr:16S rRNA (guanine(966)-N(2))-methyltransferase RsmD [Bacteroidota bacterium]